VIRTAPDVTTLRAAWWALRASRRVRRDLARGRGIEDLRAPRAPALPPAAARGMTAVLRVRRSRCLESAVVRQAWYTAQGSRRDLVIGVVGPGAGFAAHAWLEGDPPHGTEHFAELVRRPAR
jgi:hypothetical protein